MNALIFFLLAFLLKKYIFEMNSKEGTPMANLYVNDGKPKCIDTIVEQIKKPAMVTYIMDHGSSIFHTHEYCYLSYLQLDLAGKVLPQSSLFDISTMDYVPVAKASAQMLEAARCYLQDRAEYLGCLN